MKIDEAQAACRHRRTVVRYSKNRVVSVLWRRKECSPAYLHDSRQLGELDVISFELAGLSRRINLLPLLADNVSAQMP